MDRNGLRSRKDRSTRKSSVEESPAHEGLQRRVHQKQTEKCDDVWADPTKGSPNHIVEEELRARYGGGKVQVLRNRINDALIKCAALAFSARPGAAHVSINNEKIASAPRLVRLDKALTRFLCDRDGPHINLIVFLLRVVLRGSALRLLLHNLLVRRFQLLLHHFADGVEERGVFNAEGALLLCLVSALDEESQSGASRVRVVFGEAGFTLDVGVDVVDSLLQKVRLPEEIRPFGVGELDEVPQNQGSIVLGELWLRRHVYYAAGVEKKFVCTNAPRAGARRRSLTFPCVPF